MTPNNTKVVFNSSGICNACINNKKRYCRLEKRLDEFTNIIEKKIKNKKKQYDLLFHGLEEKTHYIV